MVILTQSWWIDEEERDEEENGVRVIYEEFFATGSDLTKRFKYNNISIDVDYSTIGNIEDAENFLFTLVDS